MSVMRTQIEKNVIMQTTLADFDIRLSALITVIISTYLVPAWVYILFCIFLVVADSFFGGLTVFLYNFTQI